MKIKRLDHLVLTTSSPEKCIEFYSMLGFVPKVTTNRIELFADDFKINMHVAGSELLPHASQVSPGSADLCFEIEGNMDEVITEIKSMGGVIELDQSTRSGTFGKMTSVYLRDPDGNLIELCQYKANLELGEMEKLI
jgi:catechol 2,3-dioxygenase-like lactoylglutathione lyase family enzyme